MLRSMILLLLLTVGTALASDKAPPIQKQYPLDRVAENVYVVHGPRELPNPSNQGFMNNPSFIVAEKGVVVIDPGGTVQTGEMLLTHLRKVTDKPVVAVFNTHIHGDHWLGNQAIVEAYPDAVIYAHPRTIEQVSGGEGANWVDLMARLTEGASAGTKVVGPERPADEGDGIQAAGLTFRILHNDRAHTDTDIMILAEDLGVLYLGDNAGNERILRMQHGSFRGNIEALDRASASGAKVFVPGHGPSGGVEVATSYRDYLAMVYDTVREGYDEGKADFEIRPALLPRLASWKGWAGFEHELGPHISTAFLEAEAADFE